MVGGFDLVKESGKPANGFVKESAEDGGAVDVTFQFGSGHYHFVITNSTPDFVLLPEVYTRMGDAQLLMNDVGGAYDSFKRAREIKPDYWPPYVRWANVLAKANKREEARQLIEEGLRRSPDSKPLLEKYAALDGDLQSIRTLKKSPVPAEGNSSSPRAKLPISPEGR